MRIVVAVFEERVEGREGKGEVLAILRMAAEPVLGAAEGREFGDGGEALNALGVRGRIGADGSAAGDQEQAEETEAGNQRQLRGIFNR